MSKLTTVSLAIAALAAPSFAQSSSKIVPATNGWLSGNTSATMPFGYDSFRSQQIIHASELAQTSATITSIAFRPDYETTAALSVPNVTVKLSHTRMTSATMSSSFAQNVGANPVTVYSGTVNLPAQSAPPIGPMPFNVVIRFTTPFQYVPSQGNLLIDITAQNSVPATRIVWGPDAALPGGTVESIGTSGTGVDNLTFQAHGVGSSLRESLVPGGTIEIATSMASWLPDYLGATLLALNTQTMPVDLGVIGASGNYLYVANIAAAIPHSWQLTFISKVTIAQVSVPAVPALAGADAYTQCALVVPGANQLGLVTTKALRLAIGDLLWDGTQMVSSNDPNAAQGAYLDTKVAGGAVLQLGGTFN